MFCFKQKTAYEMRISDWISDVCSSDLFPLYLGAILLATVVATAMLHRFDVYREDFLYSKRIPYGSLFAAWPVTFCILPSAYFLMKMSASCSCAWELRGLVGGGVGLAAGGLVLRHWGQEL